MKKTKPHFDLRYLIALLFFMFSSAILMAQDSANGFATISGSTTGGGSGSAVTVKTFADLKTQCASSSTLVITVEGTLTGSGAIPVKSNKTILGKGGTSKLQGFGLSVNSVSNVIIRDLKLTGSVDGIAVSNSNHVWIDHCEIWDCSDGLLDITNASTYCTVSWCKFYYVNQTDHRLACLIGAGGGTEPDDWGKNKVTYHHNWYGNKVDQRQPRLMFGQGHIYNNYYTCTGNSYCIGVGSYGMALIENNYFKGVNDPHEFMYDIFCHITARGNTYDNCTGNKQTGLGGTRKEDGQDFNVVAFTTAPYSYSMDAVSNIPALVSAGAGPRTTVINVPVTGVTVSPTSVTISKGATTQLTSTVAPSNATNKAVTWTSSNTAIATVSTSGLVTGVAKGSATITVKTTDGSKTATCAVNVTDATNTTTITIQENTTGFCSFDGTIDSDNAGFTGAGFVNTPNAINAGITWSVSIPSTGSYTLVWRHANGTTVARTAKVLVDGVALVSALNFPASGAWTIWVNTSTTLNLAAGTRKIRLQANLATGLPNIDNLSVTGVTPTAIACVGLKSTSSLESDINAASDKIVLSPNPVDNGVINISGNLLAASSMKISIYNEIGKLILSRNMGVYEKGDFNVSIPASNIKPGFYVIKVQMDAGVKTMSFIKK